jgi:hypothetical protein
MSNSKSEMPATKNTPTPPNRGRAEWERPAVRRLLANEANMPNIGKANENNDGS